MKRSAHVALVVMAATGVGATSYALMPSEHCADTPPGVAQPESCRGSRGGYGHVGSWGGSHGSFFSSSSGSGSGTSATAFSGGTARGGFGGTAHGMGGGHGAAGS